MIRKRWPIGDWKNRTLPVSKNFKASLCMPTSDGRAPFYPTLKMDSYHQILRKPRRSRNELLGSWCRMTSFTKEAFPSLTWDVLKRKRCMVGLQWSHGGKVLRKKDHEGRLFLALNATRCSKFCQEMWQLPKVWKCTTSPRRENDDHFFTLAICTMRDRHYGPLPQGKRQVRFLLVAINYFTKWVEAKALATITEAKVQNFLWKNIVCRFRIPRIFISDNGHQLDSRRFRSQAWASKTNIHPLDILKPMVR